MERIIEAQEQHIQDFLEMALDLWPDYDREDLKVTFFDILQSDKFKVLLFRMDEKFVSSLNIEEREYQENY